MFKIAYKSNRYVLFVSELLAMDFWENKTHIFEKRVLCETWSVC
jgi:hypothetical protein